MTGGRPRVVAVAALGVILAGIVGFALTHGYPVEALRPGTGEPLVLLDRAGEVMRQVPATGRPGRESWVPLDAVSAPAVATLLASEDQRFFDHDGVDPAAVLRSLYLNVTAGGIRYGGSTLTMQLMRMVHSRGRPRTLHNKLKEALLAVWLENSADKREILEQYLNRADFGNGAVGIEAAAKRYFGKPAASLSAGEASYLMVLPRGPSYYNPLKHPKRVRDRQAHLLALLAGQGRITRAQARRALSEPVKPTRHALPFEAPHFTDWLLETLPDSVKSTGGRVRTTLDLRLQQALQHRTAEHVAALSKKGVAQAGAVVLDAETGDILAMVGSSGYSSGSQVNIVTRRRHPGSALKPFVYAAAIDHLGHSPATIAYDIADVPSAYRISPTAEKERGPVRYREALAGSYNLAAVHVLEQVGVPRAMSLLRRAGVGALAGSPDDYGLRLALGSTKVRLVDLAAGYRFLVKGGKVVPPRSVLAVTLPSRARRRTDPPRETRVFSEAASWLIMDMLSDPAARRPMFGFELPADLPYPVVVKTGTARGFSDTVAVFATREYIVAAWTGRFDGRATHGVYGMKAAAPLARAGLLLASRGRDLTLPRRPDGVVSAVVCPLSGMRPAEACPHRKLEYFVKEHLPKESCDWHLLERGQVTVRYPDEIRDYVERHRRRLGQVARLD